jgi:hypothetical protein
MWRCLACLILFISPVVQAAPNAENYLDIEGVRVFRDHQKAWVWYPTPADPELNLKEGPGYGLDLYRYLGRSGTGDKEHYWTRGILSLQLKRSRPPGQLENIKKRLRKITGGRLMIKSLGVKESRIQVNFADVDDQWHQAGRWQGGVLQLVLNTIQSQLLWEADSSLLSLTVTETASMVRRENGKWVPASVSSNWTVDVPMSQEHGKAYRKTDLAAQLSMAYNEINVFCFDFLEQTQPGLYVKELEIGFPSGDRPLLERLRFDAHSDYRQHVRFSLAKTADEPLRYRIIETFEDGRRVSGAWLRKHDEFMLDITAYQNAPEEATPEETADPSEAASD